MINREVLFANFISLIKGTIKLISDKIEGDLSCTGDEVIEKLNITTVCQRVQIKVNKHEGDKKCIRFN